MYKSLDEFYDTMLRGNEIEFVYKEKCYFLLPNFKNNKIKGILFGVFGSEEEIICLSKQELYNIPIETEVFGEILSSIHILWSNM